MGRPRKTEGLTLEWSEKGSAQVEISENLFSMENPTVEEALKTISAKPRVMLVADMNVVQRTAGLGTAIGKYVTERGIELAGAPVVVGGGEKIKSDDLQTVRRLARAILEAKIGAGDVVMILGGGTLLDVAGYASAQVRGGVNIVRVPTTPAAMIDAAFSMTAAIDSANIKDALKAASRPSAILIDPTFAETVLDGVWRGGVGELVRYAAALDAPLMKKVAKAAESLHERDMAAFTALLPELAASRLKKGSTGFAQWGAARLESMSSYKLPHGYAIPIAICIDCAYAVATGVLKEDDQEFICRALADLGALDGLPHSHHLLSQADNILYGLDSWRLSTGRDAIDVPCGIGKLTTVETPDREIFKKVIKDFLAVSTGA